MVACAPVIFFRADGVSFWLALNLSTIYNLGNLAVLVLFVVYLLLLLLVRMLGVSSFKGALKTPIFHEK